MAIPKLLMIVAFLALELSAQDAWQTVALDNFVPANESYLVTALGHAGLALKQESADFYPTDFWIEGELHLVGDSGGIYYVFGRRDSTGGYADLWAAGYSARNKEIRLLAIEIGEGGQVELRPLATKPVEITRVDRSYVIKVLFMKPGKQVRVEVNGVPMPAPWPLEPDKITCMGYLVDDGSVRFNEIKEMGK